MEEVRWAGQDPRQRSSQLNPANPPLQRLAAVHGVATGYTDGTGRDVAASPDTLRAVLGALGVPAIDDEEARASLSAAETAPWRRRLPATVVVRRGSPTSVRLHLPAGASARLSVALAGGADPRPVPLHGDVVAERQVDGALVQAREALLPADLPLGWHRLVLDAGNSLDETPLAVAPARSRIPDRLNRTWGWMLQLYSLRSQASWGLGDLGDLRDLAAWSAGVGADFVLVNPLHAAAPQLPQEPSPYYPSSRRFTNPLYLRVQDVPELAGLDAADRERVAGFASEARDPSPDGLLDRDRVFRAKTEALTLLATVPRTGEREAEYRRFRAAGGQALEDFATWCALAERHDGPWQGWPAALRHPRSPAVAAARRELAERVEFHAWLQWLCDSQLAAAQTAARAAGMGLGVVHDLAVGVDPGGADGWGLQEDLASGVTVGAPPDAFNQQGQDWRLPPLRPDRLAATGFAAFRDIVGPLLRHGGGIRIDHALGLLRMFWIPEGAGPVEGTYVRYPFADLLGILTLEAEVAEAVIVAEDLGTVPEGLREELGDRGILRSAVLWFAKDGDEGSRFLRPDEYPQLALASVTTHDLPTATGWWTGEAQRVQIELDLLGDGTTPEEEVTRAADEREGLLAALRAEGLVTTDEPDLEELVAALHAFLARTPSLLVAASLADALGDVRQPNMPGTTDTYPNWRLPLPAGLENLPEHPGVRRLAAALARR